MTVSEPKLNVTISRDAKIALHPFTDYFKGFENVKAIRRIFGKDTDKVLKSVKIEFFGRRGYMGVSNSDGHIFVSVEYLNTGNTLDLYLDIVHELTHVKQFMDGKELFDNHFTYVDRPTEIEAFQNAVDEARRLGLSEERICEYLETEWMKDEDLLKLAKTLGVECKSKSTWKA